MQVYYSFVPLHGAYKFLVTPRAPYESISNSLCSASLYLQHASILYNWLNKFYSFYVAAIVGIVEGVAFQLKHIIETNLIKVI